MPQRGPLGGLGQPHPGTERSLINGNPFDDFRINHHTDYAFLSMEGA